jgi:hypothetical protein
MNIHKPDCWGSFQIACPYVALRENWSLYPPAERYECYRRNRKPKRCHWNMCPRKKEERNACVNG